MDEKELLELAKKFGDEYTYGKIIGTLKDKFIDKQKLKRLNPIVDDFSCECKNEEICAMCAFKKNWKELGL